MKHYRLVLVLSTLIWLLALIATVFGLLSKTLYLDNYRFTIIWQSNDLITLIIALPLLGFVLIKSLKGLTVRLLMTWMALIWFLFYNYAYYLFGSTFNAFYMIYLLIFSLSIPTLIYGLIDLFKYKLNQSTIKPYPYKLVGGYMLFISFGLTFVYTVQSLNFVVNGVIPEIITASGNITSIVFSLDFSMVIVTFIITAIYLFKKESIGIGLAWMLNLKSLIYMLVLSYSSYRLESSEIGLWAVIGLLSLLVVVFTMPHLNKEEVI